MKDSNNIPGVDGRVELQDVIVTRVGPVLGLDDLMNICIWCEPVLDTTYSMCVPYHTLYNTTSHSRCLEVFLLVIL